MLTSWSDPEKNQPVVFQAWAPTELERTRCFINQSATREAERGQQLVREVTEPGDAKETCQNA